LSGRADFTYVADCKLCSRKSLEHIAKQNGRFITVLPRNRREDKWFRKFVQVSEPPWEVAVNRPHPRRRSGSPDVWKVTEAQLPSKEGYRIIWVWNSLMAAEDADSRQARIEKAWISVEQLKTRLEGKRCRIRTRERVDVEIERILKESGARRWVRIEVKRMEQAQYRQANKGRPGPNTKYRKITREKFSVGILVDNELVQSDARSDGMFPLITNCMDLKPSEILAAYKSQPQLEKRFEQLKTVQDLAPVWLKNVTRIEALMFLYYIALLVHALIERQLRKAMADNGIEMLPLYPEERLCRAPCTDRILELFDELQRHEIHGPKGKLQTVNPTLTPLQKQVLRLLAVPESAFSTV
jgi:transposase